MKIDQLMLQEKKLEKYAEKMMEIRSGLARYQELLDCAWTADEMEEIRDAAEWLRHQAGYLAEKLSEIGRDLIKTYEAAEK